MSYTISQYPITVKIKVKIQDNTRGTPPTNISIILHSLWGTVCSKAMNEENARSTLSLYYYVSWEIGYPKRWKPWGTRAQLQDHAHQYASLFSCCCSPHFPWRVFLEYIECGERRGNIFYITHDIFSSGFPIFMGKCGNEYKRGSN